MMRKEKVYSKQLLVQSIKSNDEMTCIWGTYHLLSMYPEDSKDCIEYLIASHLVDIKEAGIAKVGELKEAYFAPILMNLFRNSTGRIKQACALALSQFPNDIFISLLKKWFEELAYKQDATKSELSSVTKSFVNSKPKQHIEILFAKLEENKADFIRSSIYFENLLPHSHGDDFTKLMDYYFQLRDLHSDTELTLRLFSQIGQNDLIEWVDQKIDDGLPLTTLYEHACQILNRTPNIQERQLWYELEQAFQPTWYKDVDKKGNFISVLSKWANFCRNSAVLNSDQKLLIRIIEGFERNRTFILNTIPKTHELETALLLSIPVLFYLNSRISAWLKNSPEYLEQITNYYHSSFLTKENRESILNVFFNEAPNWKESSLTIKSNTRIELKLKLHEILWKFFRGEVHGQNIDWASIFPNPEVSRNLSECLVQIYLVNFEFYIENKDSLSVDYALQLFQIHPQKKVFDLILKHFQYLQQNHTHIFHQVIEYLPSPLFYDSLLKIYKKDELEIAELILVISNIYQLEIPETIKDQVYQSLENEKKLPPKQRIRVQCQACDETYHYPVFRIYVDEESLSLYSQLETNAIWINETLNCKNCDTELVFKLDRGQINEISSFARVDRMLRITSVANRNKLGRKVQLISFPRVNQISYNPSKFDEFVDLFSVKSNSPERLLGLRLMQVRLYVSIKNWKKVKSIIEYAFPEEIKSIELYSYLGMAFYNLGKYVDARKVFDLAVQSSKGKKISNSEKAFLKSSENYINLLNNKSNKKSRFTVIDGKK